MIVASATTAQGQALVPPAAQRAPAAVAAPADWQVLEPIAGAAGAAGTPGQFVRVRFDLLAQAAAAGGTIELPLMNGVTARAAVTFVQSDASQIFIAGRLVDGQDGEATLTSVGDTLVGRIVVGARLFIVRREPNSTLHRVTEIVEGSLPPEAPPLVPPGLGAAASPGPAPDAVQADTNQFVDMMILYTPAARAAAGGTSAVAAEITGAVNNANLALMNAGVTHRFRLVHSEEVAYTETADNSSADLSNLQAHTGALSNVLALRDTYHADVVSLITVNTDVCGIGYLMTSLSGGFEAFAYNVVILSCANANLTLAHETGHNMGLQHDRANAGTFPVFPYAYGYSVSGIGRDVMAYDCPMGCPRKTIFSTPLFNFPGTSTLAGTVNDDTARALNNTSLTVANFRQSCIPTLSANSVTVGPGAGAGSVNVTVGAGCAWTAASNNPFLTVTGGSSGTGNGLVSYSVTANVVTNVPTAQRTGTITVAGAAAVGFIVTQAGCTYVVSPTGTTFGSAGGTGSVDVTVLSPCDWSVSVLPAWAMTTSGGAGSGPGTWQYSVSANGGATRSQNVSVAGQNFGLNQLGTVLKTILAGSRSAFSLADAAAESWNAMEAVAGRSYCAQVAPGATAVAQATPTLAAFRADGITSLGTGSGTNARACFLSGFSESILFRVKQAEASARSHRLAVAETTLWANWFFIGGNYSSFTLLRNTTAAQINATVTWRTDTGVSVGNEVIVIPAGGVYYRDARDKAPGATQGSVEVGHNGGPQDLVGSQTTLSATTGLSFDTVLMQRSVR